MIPVISIVGQSNSGKTTLIERLIPLLKDKGYRVGAIKHDVHHFEIDHRGKDTWRMARSGANTVVISSGDKLAMIKFSNAEKPVDQQVDWLFRDVDIVITEGYKSSRYPKIEILRFDMPVTLPENNLIAVVNNMLQDKQLTLPEEYSQVVRFDFSEEQKICSFIEARFLKGGQGG
jgi:molybdopterin-guanine dinucleotide biosynthesis protein B